MIAIPLIAVILGVLFFGPFHVSVVRHQSVRYKMVIWTEYDGHLKSGDYVVIRWTGEDPNQVGLEDGMLLTKRVGCAPGERIESDGVRFTCDGRWLGIALGKTPVSEKVLKTAGTLDRVLEEGEIFLIGDYERSYDSRYLGLFDSADVVGKVVTGM